MYSQKKTFISCNCMLTIITKLVFKERFVIAQERKKEGEKKEEYNKKSSEETFSSLFHGK